MNIKKPGYSLLEILIAMGMASIVITASIQSVGSIYFSQKKIQVSQSFSTESQFLMERLVGLVRTNTIDYDRFFIEAGPDTLVCSNFEKGQMPEDADLSNDRTNRLAVGYETIFFWDTNDDGEQDRNLGGQNWSGNIDACTQAWAGDQEIIYLINSARTLRMAIWKNGDNKIEIQQQLGADTDGDGVADLWNAEGLWDGNKCLIASASDPVEILGDKTSRDFCLQAHDWTAVSPNNVEILRLLFSPSPNRDPFLGFAIDESQIHPHVSFLLETQLRDPQDFGLEEDEIPNISLQTTASSRVFGNIRK